LKKWLIASAFTLVAGAASAQIQPGREFQRIEPQRPVAADGRIVHANVACRGIFDAGDVLSGTGGRIVARDGEADRSLRELIAAADAGDAAIGTQDIALSLRAQDGAHHVVHGLPLTSGRRPAGAHAAIAALFIRKAAIEQPATPGIIGRAYNLTPTELRVLLAIVEVGGVPEVATSLGVADTTVKTHLGRLFEKTGVGRQADLVKIVAGFSTPLAGFTNQSQIALRRRHDSDFKAR